MQTLAELRNLARKHNCVGFSKLNREDLLKHLNKCMKKSVRKSTKKSSVKKSKSVRKSTKKSSVKKSKSVRKSTKKSSKKSSVKKSKSVRKSPKKSTKIDTILASDVKKNVVYIKNAARKLERKDIVNSYKNIDTSNFNIDNIAKLINLNSSNIIKLQDALQQLQM